MSSSFSNVPRLPQININFNPFKSFRSWAKLFWMLCVCMHACVVCVCMYACACVCVCACMRVCAHMHVCLWVHVCVCTYACVCVRVCARVHFRSVVEPGNKMAPTQFGHSQCISRSVAPTLRAYAKTWKLKTLSWLYSWTFSCVWTNIFEIIFLWSYAKAYSGIYRKSNAHTDNQPKTN